MTSTRRSFLATLTAGLAALSVGVSTAISERIATGDVWFGVDFPIPEMVIHTEAFVSQYIVPAFSVLQGQLSRMDKSRYDFVELPTVTCVPGVKAWTETLNSIPFRHLESFSGLENAYIHRIEFLAKERS